MKRSQKGFSLIELLIVVAIILIIAAIAIPNLIKARMQANEASAVASIHALNTAEMSYSSEFQHHALQRVGRSFVVRLASAVVRSQC